MFLAGLPSSTLAPKAAWTALLPLAAAFVLASLAACSRPEATPEPVRAVKLITVQSAQVQTQRLYAGTVQAQTEVALGFEVAGRLLERPVQVGQTVAAGQLLARIQAQDYALGAQAAQAAVQAARTQRDLAQADWQRFSALEKDGFISPVELDRRKASLNAAQAQLAQAQAQAAVQSNQQTYTRLLAPTAGVVTAVLAEPGQVLGAGLPVLRLAQEDGRDAVFALPEDMRSQATLGQSLQVRLWGDGRSYPAQLRELAASADPMTRTYAAKAALDVPPHEQPPLGATVQVLMQAAQPKEAGSAGSADTANAALMRLPSPALWQQADGSSAVWVLDAEHSRVQAQAVELAGMDGADVLIASGLRPGQQVVAAGVHVLSEGQTVTVYQP